MALTSHPLHEKALLLAQDYRRVEVSLIEVLIQIQSGRVFEQLGYTSLYQYCVSALKLSEAQALALIAVARKSQEVPALKQKLEAGEIHLSNARRIVPLLTSANQDEWLQKAATHTQRELEREIAKVNPLATTVFERVKPIAAERSELRVGISLELEKMLEEVKDLESQRCRKNITLEEALFALTSTYLKRNDPLRRAERRNLGTKPAVPQKGEAARNCRQNIGSEAVGSEPVAGQAARTQAIGMQLLPGVRPVPVQQAPGVRPVSVDSGISVPAKRNGRRLPIPAAILHQVHLRDGRRCTFICSDGRRCDQRRWLSVHHLTPVEMGGQHSLGNLVTLCESHHRGEHLEVSKLGGQRQQSASKYLRQRRRKCVLPGHWLVVGHAYLLEETSVFKGFD